MRSCIGLIAGHSGDSLTDKLLEKGYDVAIVAGKLEEPGVEQGTYKLVTDIANTDIIQDFFKTNNVCKVIIGTGHIKAIHTAAFLEKQGFQISIDYEKSLLVKNKILFKKVLEREGIKTPKYFSFEDKNITNKITLPCVVKSATDALQPQKINNIKELETAIGQVLRTNTEVMIEEFIDGGDCTVAVSNDGEVIRDYGVIYYSKAKEYKLNGFEGAYVALLTKEQEAKICLIAKKIVKQVGIRGLVRIDFVISNDIYVLEMNSVIVTGYRGSCYPFFCNQNIDIADEMIRTALKILEKKKYDQKIINSGFEKSSK